MALEELLNTNKENYLEIDNDPAKPVNDAIEVKSSVTEPTAEVEETPVNPNVN